MLRTLRFRYVYRNLDVIITLGNLELYIFFPCFKTEMAASQTQKQSSLSREKEKKNISQLSFLRPHLPNMETMTIFGYELSQFTVNSHFLQVCTCTW